MFSVIHLRSSLNGSKIFALIRLPTIWSQQRHNGTKGRSIEIRSQFASTSWFGSFQNQVTKTFFSILYQIRFNENGCLNSKIQSVLPTSSTSSRIQLHMSLHVTAPLLWTFIKIKLVFARVKADIVQQKMKWPTDKETKYQLHFHFNKMKQINLKHRFYLEL